MTRYEQLVSDAAKAYDYFSEDELEEYANKVNPRCPECGSDDTGHGHHEANALADECDYLCCYECGHQWEFE